MQVTRRGLIRLSAVGVATLLLAACGGTTAPQPAPSAGSSSSSQSSPASSSASSTAGAASSAQTFAAKAGAYPSSIKIGIDLSITGADGADAANIRDGALMAIEDINSKGGVAGQIKIEGLVKDDGTVAAGQYDPAQGATNMRQFVSDPSVYAVIGPQSSGVGKAISPIASDADLILVTPSSTNPDITDPKFASQYRPKGKAIYFRTVTTDAYQGPGMANYAVEKLNIKTAFVLDDTGAYGEGTANAFEDQAKKKGVKILGHDKLNPKESDYTTVLTKMKGLNPDGFYFGGAMLAGVKLAKQAADLVPNVVKMGGDGMMQSNFAPSAGKAAEGWYATIAAPDTIEQPEGQEWVQKYTAKYKKGPVAYALCAYDGVLAIADSIERIVKDGKPITRSNVRDYMQQTNLKTLQGTISFDENGDLKEKIVSIFQMKDGKYVFVAYAPLASS